MAGGGSLALMTCGVLTPGQRFAYLQSAPTNRRPEMTRRWQDGAWVVDKPALTCRTCGTPIPERVGKGAPFRYCEAHAPARRATVATWQREHAEHVREYQRNRDGSRPLRTITCSDCGAAARVWSDTTLCTRCRQLARHQ